MTPHMVNISDVIMKPHNHVITRHCCLVNGGPIPIDTSDEFVGSSGSINRLRKRRWLGFLCLLDQNEPCFGGNHPLLRILGPQGTRPWQEIGVNNSFWMYTSLDNHRFPKRLSAGRYLPALFDLY